MARIATDLLKIATFGFNEMPWYVRFWAVSYTGSMILASTSSLGRKVIRWVSRDPTHYVAWNDVQGQIDRLADVRFDEMKGALAPSAIYDRRGLGAWNVADGIRKGVSVLREKGVYFLGGTAALTLATLSLYECHEFGDSSDPQLSHLLLEPSWVICPRAGPVVCPCNGLCCLQRQRNSSTLCGRCFTYRSPECRVSRQWFRISLPPNSLSKERGVIGGKVWSAC